MFYRHILWILAVLGIAVSFVLAVWYQDNTSPCFELAGMQLAGHCHLGAGR